MKIPLEMRLNHYKYTLLHQYVKMQIWWGKRKSRRLEKWIAAIQKELDEQERGK